MPLKYIQHIQLHNLTLTDHSPASHVLTAPPALYAEQGRPRPAHLLTRSGPPIILCRRRAEDTCEESIEACQQ